MLKLKQLRQSRGAKKGVLTRYCNQATDLVDVRGSRRRLQKLLSMIGAALNDVHVINDEYVGLLDADEERTDAEVYMAAVDECHHTAANAIRHYLQSRINDPESDAGSASSSASSAASRAAEAQVKVKQLKLVQLEKRLEQERQEQELHRASVYKSRQQLQRQLHWHHRTGEVHGELVVLKCA